MIPALYTAASGMEAQQTNIDVTSNNLANVNTYGFKKVRAEFKDLMYQTEKEAGTPMLSGSQVPNGIQVGMGVRNSATNRIFSQGDFQNTGNPTDLVVQGEGFFQVQQSDGTLAYSRDGAFKLDGNGNIVTSDGLYLSPQISVPQGSSDLAVSSEGLVTVKQGNNINTIGQIQLTRFVNPGGLTAQGSNLFTPTPASGDPVVGNPGQQSFGTIQQGYVEMSNVKVVDEMINLIVAQRAYEANSKSVQAADQMLSMANGLIR